MDAMIDIEQSKEIVRDLLNKSYGRLKQELLGENEEFLDRVLGNIVPELPATRGSMLRSGVSGTMTVLSLCPTSLAFITAKVMSRFCFKS
jgi:hypothetical protein